MHENKRSQISIHNHAYLNILRNLIRKKKRKKKGGFEQKSFM